jgi:dihydrofolate synthase/folylpolyglutamate synthase
MGNPQNKLKFVHIAGTNGKGSTAEFISSILIESGYRTGLFTSPFLQRFSERIRINNVEIKQEELAGITGFVREKAELMVKMGENHPTEFEIVTAIGFEYFREQKIDFLVLEVGMGGRFDATNIVKDTLVSVITSISYDHMQYLGNTLEEIAFEKAGIIKENSKVVIYPQEENIVNVIKNQAKTKNTEVFLTDKNNTVKTYSDLTGQSFRYLKTDVFKLDKITIRLLGEHQIYNALTVLCVLEILKKEGYNITEESVKKGLGDCTFAGRFEVLKTNPTIIIDGGHNINGIEYFSKAVKEYFKEKKIILFYGMLKDKNPEDVIPYLLPLCKEIYTLTPDNPRAMSSEELADLIKKHSGINVTPLYNYSEIPEVLNTFGRDEVIIFVGSLYMIGEVRTLLMKNAEIKNEGLKK